VAVDRHSAGRPPRSFRAGPAWCRLHRHDSPV